MTACYIRYWIEADDGTVASEGEYITDEPHDFIEHAKKWYGDKIHFPVIRGMA